MTEQIESGYYLDVYTKRIREACDNIRNEYVYIGFQLNELNGSELFQHEAITIAEYAEMEFGFKKSLTYSMMKVAARFATTESPYTCIDSSYKGYSFSQLVELLSVPDEQIVNYNPELTVKEIKELKKQNNTSFQTSGMEKDTSSISLEINKLSYKLSSVRINLADLICLLSYQKEVLSKYYDVDVTNEFNSNCNKFLKQVIDYLNFIV